MSAASAGLVLRRSPWQIWLRSHAYAQLSLVLFVALLVVNLVLTPGQFTATSVWVTLGTAAPTLLAAMASVPPILSGRGGIDLSVGPLMGLINVLLVQFLVGARGITSPAAVVATALLLGTASGALNGLLVSIVRLQPIVATLGTYLMYTGFALWLMPSPGGSVPGWLNSLANGASAVPVAVTLAGWLLVKRTPYYQYLMATGGDDRAAYTSGVPVVAVRLVAYVLAGLLAGVASLSLSAVLGSADATAGPSFTLTAITAVAIGGVSLAGGRGGMLGASLGALDVFLLQNLLTHFNFSTFLLRIVYGVVLVLAVVVNASGRQRSPLRSGGESP